MIRRVKGVPNQNKSDRHVIFETLAMPKNEWFRRYKALSAEEPHHVFLESGRSGRYSIAGLSPVAFISGKNNKVSIMYKGKTITKKGNMLPIIKEWLSSFHTAAVPGLPDFKGGAIGYFSYDVAREIEKLPEQAEDDLNLPDVSLLVFDDVFVYDHEKEQLFIMVHFAEKDRSSAERKLMQYVQLWSAPHQPEQRTALEKVHFPFLQESVSMSEECFVGAVKTVKEYIAAGDVFQVNLSVRQSKPLMSQPFQIYEELRRFNPSPYMGYLHTPDFQLVSGSPELLVKKRGYEISTRPIAGTRSRGKTEEEDRRLAMTLIENEKECAEHVMLVDLERNDLGKVSEYGSVEVDEFMTIEKYSHVMHIVSNVKGRLRKECDAFDLIAATFPGGTITGAPKIRTMEIIEELEPVRRGVYTGSIGWIGFDGDAELNIAIRTMVCKDGMAHVQAGAGIVIDSDPKAEYKESLKKAAALWRAKELSEEKSYELV
ncbi:aminodeoxychorismate synthase, component I [Fictibacillus enclensis]|uniref:aminodeoxychorismate synthase, component I n=1 Tax=Fictibacillus enclensis TaxID=1017270 RepID=UPI003CD0CFF7